MGAVALIPETPETAGACDAGNYETYSYNITNTLHQERLRDGTLVNQFYDHLSRLTQKDFPATTNFDVTYSYDLLNRPLYAHSGGAGVDYAYDALSRLVSEARSGQTMTYQHDAAGNSTRITWPDASPNNLYVTYSYDMLNRVTQIGEDGATSGVGLLASYTYDDNGRRTNIARAGGAGAPTVIGYDGTDRVTRLAQNFAASANDVAWTPTYSHDPSPQMVGVGSTNDGYSYHAGPVTRNYVTNGLNQYASVSSTAWSYDGRGNLASNASNSYTYDPQNRLLTASGPTPVTLTYDPTGHLQTSTTSSAATTFLYAGDMLVGEYDASGNILRRYVPGPGTDEPLVWYEGAGTSDRRWLHADTAGSVIGYSNATGASGATYAYDPYGLPDSWASGASRYRYTGQLIIPEAHLYSFKARMYDPLSGRFLQPDPVGYQSDINLYAYVNNDPINGWDPSGMDPPEVGEVVVHAVNPPPGPDLSFLGGTFSIGSGPSVTTDGVTRVAEVVVTVHRQRAMGTFGGGGGGPQSNQACPGSGDSAFTNAVDVTGAAHSAIYTGGAAALKQAGQAESAEMLARAGAPAAVGLMGLSEGYGAVQDHAAGMSWGRASAIHGTGAAFSYAGGEAGAAFGFWAGEAIFPAGGGVVGAIIGGGIGGFAGDKFGQATGGAAATALGHCR